MLGRGGEKGRWIFSCIEREKKKKVVIRSAKSPMRRGGIGRYPILSERGGEKFFSCRRDGLLNGGGEEIRERIR